MVSEEFAHPCAREPRGSGTVNRPRGRARLYYPWAELLRRTFLVDVLACPCGAKRRVLSLVRDPDEIRRCLAHLGLPPEPPARAPPRAVHGVMGF
jgi:hypothetical protein